MHPPAQDRDRLVEVAKSAGESAWLVPVVDATVVLVTRRLEAANGDSETANETSPSQFVQEAYADLQEISWDRHVNDDSALAEFSEGRVPQQPWSSFMTDRVISLSAMSELAKENGDHIEPIRLCLAIVFFQSCRFRHEANGVQVSLRLFETFLDAGHSSRDFPTFDVMNFFASCSTFERRLLGECVDAACPTRAEANAVVERNRDSAAPTQADETVLSAISGIASVGRSVALSGDQGDAREYGERLDQLMRYGLELAEESYDRQLRYFPAQASAHLHAWLGAYEQALKAGIDAVRHSSMQRLGFWLPEVMKLRSIVAEANRVAAEEQLKNRADELERELEDKLILLEQEFESRARAATERAIVPAVEVLGIFVAVLAVAAGTVGGTFVGDLGFGERVQIIALGAACALVVLAMIGVLVGRWRPLTWARRKHRG